jgi:hypothetical protein
MSRSFVLRSSLRIPINFNENEVCRIRYVLDDIEASYSRFANTVSRILHRRLAERFDRFRLDLYMDVNDLHRQYFTAALPRGPIAKCLVSSKPEPRDGPCRMGPRASQTDVTAEKVITPAFKKNKASDGPI